MSLPRCRVSNYQKIILTRLVHSPSISVRDGRFELSSRQLSLDRISNSYSNCEQRLKTRDTVAWKYLRNPLFAPSLLKNRSLDNDDSNFNIDVNEIVININNSSGAYKRRNHKTKRKVGTLFDFLSYEICMGQSIV